ncbi:MAG: hypothetical protein ACLQMT_06535 [Candidatus Acidiferrales bacterium]
MRRFLFIAVALAAAPFGAAVAARAQGQQDQGPMAPPPTYDVKRIPSVPHPGPPPIPQEQIIQKFAANEDVMKKAYDTYDFTQTLRIEEVSESGGKLTATGDVYTLPDGKRAWHVATPIASTLKSAIYSLEEVRTMATIPLFVLTSNEIANYNFLYAGQDKLDELNTYVFQVKPKQLSLTRRFFEGVIWVDDHDFAIVRSYGKLVGDFHAERDALPFKMFETYRENFQEKYWLPTYTTSDDYVDQPPDAQLHLRLIIRATGFKLQPASPPPPPNPVPAN